MPAGCGSHTKYKGAYKERVELRGSDQKFLDHHIFYVGYNETNSFYSATYLEKVHTRKGWSLGALIRNFLITTPFMLAIMKPIPFIVPHT